MHSMAYAVDLSNRNYLRKPLDFNRGGVNERWSRCIEEFSGLALKGHTYTLGSGNGVVELPLLFYEKEDLGFAGGFIATNEFDWFKQGIDRQEADIFVGFGNNSVWDLAVRRNAKIMVIGDNDENVVIAQEYLYKPLLLIAQSPAEFISMIAAVPIPKELNSAALGEVFDFIDDYLKKYPTKGKEPTADRAGYINEIVKRIEENPSLGAPYAAFVNKQLNWIARPERSATDGYDGVFSGMLIYDGRDNPYAYFRYRYNPKKLIEKGADPDMVIDPYFSCFSSTQAFERLKNMFEKGNVYYFVSDITDRRAYKAIGGLAQKLGRKISGFSTCNIIDYISQNPRENLPLMLRILNIAIEEMEIDPSFTVYNTRGIEQPYSYEVHNIASLQSLGVESLKHGYRIEDINRKIEQRRLEENL